MTQNRPNYSKQNMNNMINQAKRQAMEMNKKSTNRNCSPKKIETTCNENPNANTTKNANNKNPSMPPILSDLLGNFNLSLNFDEDTLLLGAIIYILYRQQADSKLLIALLYVLLF